MSHRHHYFYGSTGETLEKLREKLLEDYPGLDIVGMYSPPFRPTMEEENQLIVERVNELQPDFIWVGLSCPEMERWMYEHLGRVNGLVVGVDAGFDYYAGNINRAPEWMQKRATLIPVSRIRILEYIQPSLGHKGIHYELKTGDCVFISCKDGYKQSSSETC